MRSALLVFALALIGLGAAPAAAQGVTHFTLANGLEVVAIPDRRTPVVTHMVWYRVGSADEPAGKSGIAHFLEHLMFKGTAKQPDGAFSKIIAGLGGQENAFTSNDYTGYFQRVTREHLRTMMEFEADRMTGLVLTDPVVKPELNVVLEEQYQRVANDPAARLGEAVQAALYLNHPYGRPIIGWRHEIEKLTREDAIAFYERHYSPNNAILVVAGDITPEEVRSLAEETYGKVKVRSMIAPRKRPTEPEPIAERVVRLADARVAQPSLQRMYLVPSYTTAGEMQAEAIDVLAHIMGHGSLSRLYRALVTEQKIATSARAYYTGSSLDDTRLAIYATPRPGVSLEQLAAAIDAVLVEIIEKGVTAEELARAKTRMVADLTYALDNQTSMARLYGVALTSGLTVESIKEWPGKIHSVTPEQVQQAARQWLKKNRSVTGFLVKDEAREEKRS